MSPKIRSRPLRPEQGDSAELEAQHDEKHLIVRSKTDRGQITVRLDLEWVPVTTRNFLEYVASQAKLPARLRRISVHL